ncbi:hypothetical protein CLV78_101591 [Aliiruegeria haliotis]|uniref:Uncharacterized protein n=1 Tax=Aliiruegeria haliotis TaxID=1280846 RepID=A0A2T0RZ90_9RHOB|nr:hypothetical protein [Aliiruegeria haliotis]PRY26495.1 hypothetical protein CLV78_101591 [Aliiruegeria haliotis]
MVDPIAAAETKEGAVRRRRVIYVPGYDPFHARRYRELYRKEARAQAEISGYEITVSSDGGQDPYSWFADARIEGQDVRAEISVLGWSDIVKESMDKGLWETYRNAWRTLWIYLGSGALGGLVRLRKGPVIAAIYPLVFLVLQLLAALLVAWGIGWTIALVAPAWMGVAGLLAVPPVLRWFARHDNKILARYLMHNYAFSARDNGANPAALEARIEVFTDVLRMAVRSDVDEVLVVGHSSGAHLAVSMLADLLRAGDGPDGRPVLSFLTLGQVIPMASFLPDAKRLRADLAYVAASPEVDWVDVTAPGDGCAFALCDPVGVSGVAPDGQRGPLVLSAAFTQTLSAERWRALRWRFFRLHFQYLCAFDRPGDYDYFRITAGPQTLAERFGHRRSSRSVKADPVSRHRSVA